jgi:hypothetical protein
MFGRETTLEEFNSYLRTRGYQAINKGRGILLQETIMRHKGHNFGGWIDRKLFYDREDLVRLANHWLLGTYERESHLSLHPFSGESKALCKAVQS